MNVLRSSMVIGVLLLSGCSPHPGAGIWSLVSGEQADITKIEIHFEPKVDIYGADSSEPVMQCGWWAKSRQVIEMECVWLKDTEKKSKYLFSVTGKNSARFSQGDQLIGDFERQKP